MTYPTQPAPYYPPQAQQPAPPYYPQQQPQYAPPAPAYYPPPEQSYAPSPASAAPAPPPVPHGTLDDFYSQPVGSGKSLTFDRKPVGFTYAGVVSRTITSADIQAQTDIRNRSVILRHPDGRVKYVMIVPLQMQPSQEFPDGRAAWYVKGADRTELEAAMERAGCKPGTPPEMGAVITITYTGERPIPGLNPQKMKQVTYQRPNGAQANPVPGVPATAPAMHAPAPVNGTDPYAQQPGGEWRDGQLLANPASAGSPQAPVPPAPPQQPAYSPPLYMTAPPFQAPQYEQPAPPPAPAPYAPAPAQAPQAPAGEAGPAPVPGLSAEQQALLARLTGNAPQ